MRKDAGLTLVEMLVAGGLGTIIIAGGFFGYDRYTLKQINNYESCSESRGSIIMESYPEQCKARNGNIFTHVLSEEELDRLPPAQIDKQGDVVQASSPHESESVPERIIIEEDGLSEQDSKPLPPPPEVSNAQKPLPPEEGSVPLPFYPLETNEIEIPPTLSTPSTQAPEIVVWNRIYNGWEPSGTPPACPSPLTLETPTNLSLATSVLYPGQERGGNYKPHGGFRYDNSKSDDIVITAPMDAQVVNGGRYLAEGEVQYTFDFINSCGIWYRFGHIKELSPKLRAVAETFPEPTEDSLTYEVRSTFVTQGEVIATAVGFADDDNVFVDWGVYDLRSKNEASQNSTWAKKHPGDQEQYAVCWFDLLSPKDEKIVRKLPPADGVNGSKSDYCSDTLF